MKNYSRLLFNSIFMLAILSTGALVFNMLGIFIYKQQVFFEQEALSGVEIIILIGFGLVLLFDGASFLWNLLRLRQAENRSISDKATLVFGVLCPILLIVGKVMVDEIAREYRLGWEVLGEWIILYAILAIQLGYSLAVVQQLLRTSRDRLNKNKAQIH